MILILLLLAQIVTGPNWFVQWSYAKHVSDAEKVEVFLVCFDGQTTANCAKVPITVPPCKEGVIEACFEGVGTDANFIKTFFYPLPPLLGGSHTVSVQACTVGAMSCASGTVAKFEISITNVSDLKVVKK